MMRTTTWIILGLAFNGAAAMLYGPDTPTATDLARTVPYYLPSAALIAAGQFCFFRAFRSALGDVWRGLWGGKSKGKAAPKPAATMAFADPEAASDFDPDAAFARYMERRQMEEEATGDTQGAAARQPAAPVRAAGGFGRRII